MKQEKLRHSFFSFFSFSKLPKAFRILGICLLMCFVVAAQKKGKPAAHKKAPVENAAAAKANKVTYNILTLGADNFGYDILENNKILVHQPTIPGVPGNNGFKTKAEAIRVAKLVKQKIVHNQMPPTISERELQTLNIKH